MVKQGNLLALKTGTTILTFWSAQTGGTQYTDLLDVNSAPISSVIVSGYQIPRFSGPDGITTMWAYDGRSDRFLMEARNPDFTGASSKLDTNSFGKFVGAPTGVAATDTANINAALAAASADSKKPPVIFAPGTYVRNAAITPYTGMRFIAIDRGSEFGYGTKIVNTTTDMFTPTTTVSDVDIEGIQFEGNTSTRATDWWTVGTGFQLNYSNIDKCGFTYFKRVYHGDWVGTWFTHFYVNLCATDQKTFNLTGADAVFGPGFIGAGGYSRTTLTSGVTAGAGPKTLNVADATGAQIGNPVYIGDPTDPVSGPSGTRDVVLITNVAGNVITVGTLANAHNSGDNVHIVLDTAVVETQMSHATFYKVYISPGWGMALHVTGGHSSNFIANELSGLPIQAAGAGLYVVNSRGHQFIGTNIASVALLGYDQFNAAAVIYDSQDLNFTGTMFTHMQNTPLNLFRLGRSGGGGVLLTDRINISGTTRYDVNGGAVTYSENTAMAAATANITSDMFRDPLWFPTYKTASYYFCNSPAAFGTASATLGNGTLRLTPWTITRPVTIARVGAEFTVAGDAASVFRVGIYADDGTGVPTGSPVLDAGSISTGTGNAGTVATGGTPGRYDITLGTAILLQPGLYWVGGAVQGVTTTQPTIGVVAPGSMVLPFPSPSIPGASSAIVGYQLTGVTGALGAWSGTTQAGSAPRIHFKTA